MHSIEVRRIKMRSRYSSCGTVESEHSKAISKENALGHIVVKRQHACCELEPVSAALKMMHTSGNQDICKMPD